LVEFWKPMTHGKQFHLLGVFPSTNETDLLPVFPFLGKWPVDSQLAELSLQIRIKDRDWQMRLLSRTYRVKCSVFFPNPWILQY
jgi:hypothetical protein